MRIGTVAAGLLIAVLFSLEGYASSHAEEPKVKPHFVVVAPNPVYESDAKVATESSESPPEVAAGDVAGAIPVEASVASTEAKSAEVSHHEQLFKNSSLTATGRNADYMADGKDLWREFFHSLYVDRYGRGVKTQTALSALNVGNLAVLGIVVLGGLALVAPVIFPEPYKRSFGRSFSELLTEERQLQKFITSGLVGVSENIMGWVEKSVDDLPSFPRLDAQECMKRSICEAHNQPKKYGLVGLVLQLFFPPYTETEEPSRIVSKYQLAARYGRQEQANCAAQYDGCMVNFLDAVQGVINFVF